MKVYFPSPSRIREDIKRIEDRITDAKVAIEQLIGIKQGYENSLANALLRERTGLPNNIYEDIED